MLVKVAPVHNPAWNYMLLTATFIVLTDRYFIQAYCVVRAQTMYASCVFCGGERDRFMQILSFNEKYPAAEIHIIIMEVFRSKWISLNIYLFIGNYFARGAILNLSNNNLTDVPPPPINITAVSKLYLQNNFIRQLHQDAFKMYTDFIYLNLDANGLRMIHDGVFDNISTLTHLYLENNNNKVSA